MNSLLILGYSYLSAHSDQWLGGLLETSLKGALVLAAAASVDLLLKRSSSATRHLLWNLALCSLIALPLLAFVVPARQVILPGIFSARRHAVTRKHQPTPLDTVSDGLASEAITGEKEEIDLEAEAHQKAGVARGRAAAEVEPVLLRMEDPTAGAASLAAPSISTEQQPVAKPESAVNWSAIVLAVWVAGVLIGLARLVAAVGGVRRLIKSAMPMTDAKWARDLRWLSAFLGVDRGVRLLKTGQIAMPMTWGLLRPVILLPEDAAEWAADRRSVVLLHELAHVKRLDCFTQIFSQLACAVYWFNPLLQLAARRLRTQAERACDDYVLDSGARASDYAEHLLQIARAVSAGRRLSLAAVSMARPSQLEERMLAILDPGLNRRRARRTVSVLVSLAICAIVLSLASLRATAAGQETQASTRAEVSLQQNVPVPGAKTENGVNTSAAAADKSSQQAQSASQDAGTAESIPSMTEHVDRDEQEPPEIEPHEQDHPAPSPTVGAAQGDRATIVEALATALRDEDVHVRRQAAFALSELGDDRAAQVLAGALKDKDPVIRAQAVQALGLHGGSKYVDALIGALKDENASVREQAAQALGLSGDNRAVQPLIAALKDQDGRVRGQATQALGLRGDQRVVEPLIGAMKDSDSRVRAQAAQALGLRGDQRVVEPLIGAMKDSDSHVRAQATQALGLRGDKRVVEPLIAAMKDPDSHVRIQAAQALGLRGDSRVVDPLIAALKDSDPRMRCIAAESLGLRGDHRAVDALKEALKDENSRVRQRAAEALGLLLMRTSSSVKAEVDLEINAAVRSGVTAGVEKETEGAFNRAATRARQRVQEKVKMGASASSRPSSRSCSPARSSTRGCSATT